MEGRILPGSGRVVHMADTVVVVGDNAPVALVAEVHGMAGEGQAGLEILERLRTHRHADEPSLGVLTRTDDGWLVRIGAGLIYRADHIGYRSTVAGPVDLVTPEPLRVAVGPEHMPTGPAADHPELRDGAWLGLGAWVETSTTAGRNDGTVDGVVCEECGAFVHPLTLECRRCQQPLGSPRTPQQQSALPVATLRFDDGTTTTLAGSVVIGREPQGHEDVVKGLAEPLVLSDSERSVSRAHAALVVRGWDVYLRDLGSPNGTSVRMPSAPKLEVLESGQEIGLLPGTEIALGRRHLTVDG